MVIVLAGVAQLIGASSRIPKGCGFGFQLGHITKFPLGCEQEATNCSLTSVFLSLFPSLSISLGEDF